MRKKRIVGIEVREPGGVKKQRKKWDRPWAPRRNMMFSQHPSGCCVENGPQAAEGGTWETRSSHNSPEKEQRHIKPLIVKISRFL